MEPILWWIIGVSAAILGWLLRMTYTAQTKKLEAMEQEIKKIKENYLDRFEKMNTHVTKSKEEIIDKLHTIELASSAKIAASLVESTAIAVALALKTKKTK